jgi:outer membrane immunogenic protein
MPPQMFAPTPVWNGIYFGLHGGWGWGDVDRSFAATDNFLVGGAITSPTLSNDVDGGIFGGHMGYNWQVGPNWLIGLEGSIAWGGIDGRFNSALVPGAFVNTDLDWFATITPRIGWANNNYLFYVKGGLAGGRADTVATVPPDTFNAKNSFLGWTVGVGLEYMWSPNWILGIEYNYYDLGRESVGGVFAPGGLVATQNVDLKFSSVLARVSYKY